MTGSIITRSGSGSYGTKDSSYHKIADMVHASTKNTDVPLCNRGNERFHAS